jgi:hypothetical protein
MTNNFNSRMITIGTYSGSYLDSSDSSTSDWSDLKCDDGTGGLENAYACGI